MFDNSRVTTRHDLRITKPCDRFAHVLNIFARVGYYYVASVNLGERHGCFRSDEGNGFCRPNSVVRVNLTVVDAANTRFRKYGFGQAIASHEFGDIPKCFELHPIWAEFRN